MPRKKRDNGKISIEQAKEKFIEFYDRGQFKNTSEIGRRRAKMFDMMYQKKPKYSFKCNRTEEYDEENDLEPGMCEEGSEKYIKYDMGPRTFDIEGVDSFEEGEYVEVPDNIETHITSKGSTYKKDSDTHILETDTQNTPRGRISDKIYGPRLLRNNELYNKHFKDKYNRDKESNVFGVYGDESDRAKDSREDSEKDLPKNLVEIYWDQYRESRDNPNIERIERRNKKKRAHARVIDYDSDDTSIDQYSSDSEDDSDSDDASQAGLMRTYSVDGDTDNLPVKYSFLDSVGNEYYIDKYGTVYDGETGKDIGNIITEDLHPIITQGALDYNLITKIAENTYMLNEEGMIGDDNQYAKTSDSREDSSTDISDTPTEEPVSEETQKTEEYVIELDPQLYYIESLDKLYLHDTSSDNVYPVARNDDGDIELDIDQNYDSFEEFLDKLNITEEQLQKEEVDFEF